MKRVKVRDKESKKERKNARKKRKRERKTRGKETERKKGGDQYYAFNVSYLTNT
jgi:hypothetical protein